MPPSNSFVDHVQIYFTSGMGGNGVISWRREKYIPKGGPDGGDGGRGGHIILEGDEQMWTLLDLKYRKFIKAGHGENGSSNRKTGKSGRDEILKVPLGTVIKNAETNEFIGEVTKHGQRLMLIKAGHGGRGNWNFKSPTNQAPNYATPGGDAQELVVIMELKVLADVGLVGLPNAGKSTLLSVVTAAKPKIADYPFTTLVPNLGIVKYHDYKSFVIADIPGIIEGAHEGKGLGHQFLRHIERNAILLIMISVESDDIIAEYKTIINELREYNPDLATKRKLLAISKTDMLGPEELAEIDTEIKEELPELSFHMISAVSQSGISQLKDLLWEAIND